MTRHAYVYEAEVELLADIDWVYELRWIPAIREAVFDRSEVRSEIESCTIFLLEDARGDFRLFREAHSYTSIFILYGDSLFYKLFHDIFHRILEIWIVFAIWSGKSESLIEALTDIVSRMDIEKI